LTSVFDTCTIWRLGALAQLGERLLCKQDVVSSNLSGSTKRNTVQDSKTTG
jgi:hypothetical protein